ncbi:unnamed protein product [Citrullus colocynthis]|uniref:Uncharacterized protein n=1 Tax=Citrullus colocynthis TaxID=252529 RepID=A0ABP0ZDL0_9ROSI
MCCLLWGYIKSLNLDSNNTARHQKKRSAPTPPPSTIIPNHNQPIIIIIIEQKPLIFFPNDWTVPDFDFKEESENQRIYGFSINSHMEDIGGASVGEANNCDRKIYNDNEETVEFRRVEVEKLQYYAPVSAAAAAGMKLEVKKKGNLLVGLLVGAE